MFYNLYCRAYQNTLRVISNFLPWREPELIDGVNSIEKLPGVIKNKTEINQILLVTDENLASLGLMNDFLAELGNKDIEYYVYDNFLSDPAVEDIENGLQCYKDNKCQGIVAFGGGSPIDCAKGIAARVARPEKNLIDMEGLLKVRKETPSLFAVPTTAGTGSEATVSAVIKDNNNTRKFVINDIPLIPDYAVHDPTLTVSLPPEITAYSGMDALTHAVEAYINKYNTERTRRFSEKAVNLIFNNLEKAYNNGENLEARRNMLKASYYAGLAFTRNYVGYCHAMTHALGGMYDMNHGRVNGIILPYLLKYYGDYVYEPLAKLAEEINIIDESIDLEAKTQKFIARVEQLREKLNIDRKINFIEGEDLPKLVENTYAEANPLYPVPKILSKKDIEDLFQLITD